MRLRLFVTAILLCALSIQCSDNPGAGTDCTVGNDCAKVLRCENDLCVPADGFVNQGGDSVLPEDTESDVDNEDTQSDSTDEDTISDISEEEVSSDVATDTAINDSTEDVENSCGNGFVDDGEDCDDGNDNEDDLCHSDCTFTCGDGLLQPMEECDTAIAKGEPGACPSSCESTEACTVASVQGNECAQTCVVSPVSECVDGDNCCGFGCNNLEDPDCLAECGNGIVEEGETCDPVGSCPTSCNDDNTCTTDTLVGALALCNAACSFSVIELCKNDDGCCPAICTSATDNDCSASCGNNFVDPGESCDPPSSCPTSCDDSDPCTEDTLTGSAANCNVACSSVAIVKAVDSDLCCPDSATANNDNDCDPVCNNAVVESGESCDPPESCPSPASCNDSNNCTADSVTGSAADCNAVCVNKPISEPVGGDNCCPKGANANNDTDCSAQCGNSTVEAGETCDPPTSCPITGDCNDSNNCTTDTVTGAAILCTSACVNTPITQPANNDGCCPNGANANNDNDCSANCGNSSIEASETCDPPSDCPSASDCQDNDSCTADSLTGSAANCNAACVNVPITLPANGDGCCPQGANANNDKDCKPVCNNGVIESGETCDPQSSCPSQSDCSDGIACTADSLSGSASVCTASCVNTPINQPANNDGCCPAGATANNDNDCNAQCNNGVLEAGETCDPPSSCPTATGCNDNNSCTTDGLTGSAGTCTAACVNNPISLPVNNDGCCPAGANANNDNDCQSICNNAVVEPGETCDPPGSCPSVTDCADTDVCTADSLSGSADKCTAQCTNTPISSCANGDGCCPKSCNSGNDSDCGDSIDPNSTVTTTSSCLTRTTNAQAAIVVTLMDTNGNGVTNASVTMTSSAGSLSAVQSNGNTYWTVLSAPSNGGSTQLSVTADGIILNTNPTINFVAPFTSLAGGMGGCPADGNARIRVVTPAGAPIQNALVMLGNSAAPASLQSTFNIAADSDNTGTTGAGGYVEFHDFGPLLDGGITVTAVIAGRRYMTFVDGNASDFIVPLASINPVSPKGVFSGDITGFNAPNNNPIELGVQFPEIDLEDFVGFSLDALLSDNECYAAGGFAGNSNIPANIYIPKQCAASLFFCVQTLPEHPYKTAPIPYGPERLLALSGAAPLDALTSGDIGGAVSQITFTKIGMSAVNVSSAGPTTQDINVSSNLIADVSCSLNNAPPSSDVFCLTAGDWDSNAKGLTPGAGSLYLSGFKSVDTAATALPTTLTNITRVPKNSAPWAGTDSVSAAAALYLDETKAGVDPGVINGVTIVAQRTNVGTNLSFDTFIPIRTQTRTGRNYSLSALSGVKHPAAHTVRASVSRKVTTIYNGCETGDSEHVDRQTLWTIYMRGSSNGFILPTPPASWPGGTLGGDIQGLVDVNATPQSDILEWKSMTVHEGLNTGYNFDQMKVSSFRESSTHVSSNTVAY